MITDEADTYAPKISMPHLNLSESGNEGFFPTGAERREWEWGLLGLSFKIIVDRSIIPYV